MFTIPLISTAKYPSVSQSPGERERSVSLFFFLSLSLFCFVGIQLWRELAVKTKRELGGGVSG